MFPDDATAEQWFIETRWPDGVQCTVCQSLHVHERKTIKRSWRCRVCRKDFSTRTETPMQSSKLGFQVWAKAIFLLTAHLKGIASTKLASDLHVTQKTAWHMAMRIRETYRDNVAKRVKEGHGPVGKSAVVGMKSRDSPTSQSPSDCIGECYEFATLRGGRHDITGHRLYRPERWLYARISQSFGLGICA